MTRLVAVGQAGISVRRVGGDQAGEMRFTRFLRNPRVGPPEMTATARARTASLVKGRHVLAIQDTTSLRDDGKGNSLNLHAMIAVDADDGGLLGLIDAVFLRHDRSKKKQHSKHPFAEKESSRWLAAANTASGLFASGAECITVVADREGYIYEAFARRPAHTDLVIRAHHDRILEDGSRLYDSLKNSPELGRETIDLPANAGRRARQAVLVLKARPITLKKPKNHNDGRFSPQTLPKALTLTLVEAQELNPPAGVTPAHWWLLTTHDVTTFKQALQITHF